MTPRSLIRRARKVLIMAHLEPDGDAIGSALALGRGLETVEKEVRLACEGPLPSVFDFLPGIERFELDGPQGEDLAIALDASDLSRFGFIGEEVGGLGLPLLNIDHHITNTMFGTVNLVRPQASATAEIVYDLLVEFGVPLDPLLATYLLVGIVTDTQGFRTPSTTIRSLELALRLMRAGAPLSQVIANLLNRRDLAELRLWGRVIEGLQVEGRVIWATESLALRRRFRAPGGRVNGLINLLASVEQADIAILFKEREKGVVDVSLRSRPGVDVSSIAQYFGGGGHPQAAGCSLEGGLKEVQRRVLAKVKEGLSSSPGRGA